MINLIFSLKGYDNCLKVSDSSDTLVVLFKASNIEKSLNTIYLGEYSNLDDSSALLALLLTKENQKVRSWY